MDATLKIRFPQAAWTVNMATTAEGAIIMRVTLYIILPNGGTISIVFNRRWFSISAWEMDMKQFLERLVNERNAIVECRIKIPRYSANETETQLREVLLQILEIPD